MEFFKERIVVKSTNENFDKEKSGIKNNTVREINESEYYQLLDFQKNIKNNPTRFVTPKIVIRNVDTGEFFEREITDITKFKDYIETEAVACDKTKKVTSIQNKIYLYIISFNHKS